MSPTPAPSSPMYLTHLPAKSAAASSSASSDRWISARHLRAFAWVNENPVPLASDAYAM